MNPQQLGILNALVTFAAENIPAGLSEDEREVAKIVGGWALEGEIKNPTPSTKLWDEFWRVVRFLDHHQISFERVNDQAGFDRDPVYINGHRLQSLATQYISEQKAGKARR